MGIYGEGLEGKPHVRNYSFKQTVEEITTEPTGKPPSLWPFCPIRGHTFGDMAIGMNVEPALSATRPTSPHGSTGSRSWNGRKKEAARRSRRYCSAGAWGRRPYE